MPLRNCVQSIRKMNSVDSLTGQFSRAFERAQNVSFAPVNLPRTWRANGALTYRHNPPANERPSRGPYVLNERAPPRLMDFKHAFEILRFRELFRSRRRKATPPTRTIARLIVAVDSLRLTRRTRATRLKY